ncbi:MAG: protoheme IX farnesyltransferase [Chloroflexi bacterium GWC2_73_18]|nr:MAG: protoheme IX farnesyltransferase [Chloroflexi bacterium GWC2_73_18]
MTGFRRLVLAAIAASYLLVIVGVFVRASGSGLGCPDWPLCHGSPIPPLDDRLAVIEWSHRSTAAVVGLLIVAIAAWAVVRLRRRSSLFWGSLGALALVVFQSLLGRGAVLSELDQEIVTAHLAAAMALLGSLVFLHVRAGAPAVFAGRGASQRFTLLAAFAALSVYALLLFGAHVRATGATLAFPDWPLFGGALLPDISDAAAAAQFTHRAVAVAVGLIVLLTAAVAARSQRQPGQAGLAVAAAVLFAVQVVVGAAQIWTTMEDWAVVAHLALGAAIWALLVALAFRSYVAARGAGDPVAAGTDAGVPRERSLGDTVRSYVALTKPRIIELLLVTTVPAMVVAARGIPPLDLVAWTLLGGALAAGSANAINCYLDRDIDELMARTRRRPLPAQEVEPDRALLFGIALGVLAFAELVILVNLLAAFLSLLAIAFYVFVYTLWLKRTTPQNIVIGGAAGALPPVIGWAAVTGGIGVPALVLFALVFYWTPPHFWALAMRTQKDYAAAGIPMLPVVRGERETARQIGLYSILMVAITLVFFAVARMGPIYLAAALALGAVFLYQALALWRDGTSARAVRLYKYSTGYLALLFAGMVVDQLVPLGF